MAHMDRKTAQTRIRKALKTITGRAWSVTGDRGTAWGWITVHAMPKDRVGEFGYLSDEDAETLTLIIYTGFGVHRVSGQGHLVSPDDREWFTVRLEGLADLSETMGDEFDADAIAAFDRGWQGGGGMDEAHMAGRAARRRFDGGGLDARELGVMGYQEGCVRVAPSELSTADKKEWYRGWDAANIADEDEAQHAVNQSHFRATQGDEDDANRCVGCGAEIGAGRTECHECAVPDEREIEDGAIEADIAEAAETIDRGRNEPDRAQIETWAAMVLGQCGRYDEQLGYMVRIGGHHLGAPTTRELAIKMADTIGAARLADLANLNLRPARREGAR